MTIARLTALAPIARPGQVLDLLLQGLLDGRQPHGDERLDHRDPPVEIRRQEARRSPRRFLLAMTGNP
jgi:hypothetical protein